MSTEDGAGPIDGEDVDIARDIGGTVDDAELFLYPGSAHLFADDSTPDYDERAARLLMRRVLSFLDSVA